MQGEQVLKLAEMCRKLETEEEKVLPFYASSLWPEEDQKVASAAAEPPSEPLATVYHSLSTSLPNDLPLFQVMQEYSSLQNFWQRYNKVLLDKLSLDREKQILEDENSKLKLLLKQYLDGKSTIVCHLLASGVP